MTNEIGKYIENSEFYKKYGRKSHYQVGSTIVYPIQIWVDTKEVEIHLDGNTCKQWHKRGLDKLVKEITDRFGDVVADWWIWRSDGSCPDEARINLK